MRKRLLAIWRALRCLTGRHDWKPGGFYSGPIDNHSYVTECRYCGLRASHSWDWPAGRLTVSTFRDDR